MIHCTETIRLQDGFWFRAGGDRSLTQSRSQKIDAPTFRGCTGAGRAGPGDIVKRTAFTSAQLNFDFDDSPQTAPSFRSNSGREITARCGTDQSINQTSDRSINNLATGALTHGSASAAGVAGINVAI
ncbi:hypothetical protein EVAR_53868_1 [Eumeta japonica]|uniref:Uncharacterized protein n=1 Tax=Eumeta variegata TaxID=151549 RepID=A0A4C1XG64_EUMVA|nr:hypothetical protein EVAR_53868_1 [Eumeta japonica]